LFASFHAHHIHHGKCCRILKHPKSGLIGAIWYTMKKRNAFPGYGDNFETDSFEDLAESLVKYGGEPRFLEFLRRLAPPALLKYAKPRHDQKYWNTRERAVLRLYGELQGYYPTISAEELVTLSSLADKLSVLGAFQKAAPAALHGVKRGAPIRRYELYFWFAALVPYTLFATGRVRWDWIGRWIDLVAVTDDDRILEKPQHYWNKVVQSKAQGNGLSLQMRSIFMSGTNAYRQWLREGKPKFPKQVKSPAPPLKITDVSKLKKRLAMWKLAPSKDERRYVEAVIRMLPALREQFQQFLSAKQPAQR